MKSQRKGGNIRRKTIDDEQIGLSCCAKSIHSIYRNRSRFFCSLYKYNTLLGHLSLLTLLTAPLSINQYGLSTPCRQTSRQTPYIRVALRSVHSPRHKSHPYGGQIRKIEDRHCQACLQVTIERQVYLSSESRSKILT